MTRPAGYADPEYGASLSPEELPRRWYNIVPDLPEKLAPMLDPHTLKPVTQKSFEALFPKELVRQQFSEERWLDIPEPVWDAYRRLPRPTPLVRARRPPRPAPRSPSLQAQLAGAAAGAQTRSSPRAVGFGIWIRAIWRISR